MKSKFYLQPLTAAICVACYSGSAWAEKVISTQMAPIVATAYSGNDANGLIVHADPKNAIQPIPASDGASYLQSIVGFNAINSGAGANSDVTFRGMFGSRIKIVTDGTENLGACPSRMDSPTTYIAPESYDEITLIKGPQTVQYANTGSAATVLFERKPERFTENEHYRGQASILYGSFGRWDQNLETAVGDETKYIRFNANRSISDDYKDGAGQTVRSNWERWNTDVALGWTPDANTWLELNAGTGDGEVAYAGRAMDGSQFKRQSLGLRFEKTNISDVIEKIEGQVNYNYNNHIMDNYSLRTPPPTGKRAMQVTRRTVNSRLAMTTNWGEQFSLKSGIDSQFNKHGGGMISMNMPITEDMKFQSYGLFNELTYHINDDNQLISGLRFDRVDITSIKTNRERKKTLPSGFIRFENALPEHGLKNYIGVGYVERTPDYWELFRTNYRGVAANTFEQLKSEKTVQLDLGAQFEHGAWNAWTSAYVGHIKDFILMSYQGSVVNSNNVDANIAGAEAGLGYQFTDQLKADVSAMYAWGENTTDSTPLAQIAPLEARFNLNYVTEKYSLGALWRVVAPQNRISLNQGNIVGYDIGKSKGFATLALNATYKVMDNVDFSVGIDNVFNKNYAEHLNKLGVGLDGQVATEQFNNVGRNYWMRMNMKF